MSIAKVIEVLSEGNTLEEATENAVRDAGKSVKNIKHVYVKDFQGIVEDGSVSHYRINAKVTFVIEGT